MQKSITSINKLNNYKRFYVRFAFFVDIFNTSGEVFIRGIIRLSNKFNFSSFVSGATIVAFGNVSPEFIFALTSAYNHYFDVSLGSLIGSAVANILLCIGITSLISGIHFDKKNKSLSINMLYHMLFFTTSIFLIIFLKGRIGIAFSIYLILSGILFLFLNLRMKNKDTDEKMQTEQNANLMLSIFLVILGLCGLSLFSSLLLNYLVSFSEAFGIEKKIISSTLISLGNSSPEIVTTILYSLRRRSRMIFGNVIGSSLLILSLILGTSALIYNLIFKTSMQVIPSILQIDLPFLLFASLLFFTLFKIKNQFGAIIGLIFIFLYLLYILLQVNII